MCDSRKVVTAEDQLRNVAECVFELTTPSKSSTNLVQCYSASKGSIASSSRQLAEIVLEYLDGELVPIVDDGNSF